MSNNAKTQIDMKVVFLMKTSNKLKNAMELLEIKKLRKHQIEPINALVKEQDVNANIKVSHLSGE